MYVDVELISNNTYQNSTFTYQVPIKLKDKINLGSIVIVPFRNKDYKAIVVSISNVSLIENPKQIKKYLNVTLTKNQIKYLQQLAISYRLNVGILLYNFVDISTLKKQNVLKEQQINNIAINNFINFDNKKNNVFFVPSLKICKELYNYLSDYLHIDFYQRYGGKEEIDVFKNNKLNNIILLNTNFDKLIIDNKTNYYFYDSNNSAWKLQKLNNLNVVEAAYIKNKIFGGNFSFINYFPNLEFHNEKVEINRNFSYEIEYFYGNSLQDCIDLYTIKYKGEQKHFYSNNKLPEVKELTFAEKLTEKEVEGILIVNPTLLTNNILNSYKVIYLLFLLNYAQKNNINIVVFSTTEIDINKVINSKNMSKWILKEQNTRLKFGPSLLNKVFTFNTSKKINVENNEYIRGPIELNDDFLYEINIDLNKSYDYLKIMKMFKNLKDYEISRARFI
tara:strand:+ start:171 stop:1514 length:1344 start_codon:yes stop_codon:yes gene_type:complete